MQYEYPWIPEGDVLELRGQIAGVRADLVKGEMAITLKVPVSPYTLKLSERLRVIVDLEMSVAVDVQALRMTMEKLADMRSAPVGPGEERQFTLGDVMAEVAERANAGELDEPGVTVTATVGGLTPLPTLLEAQIAEATEVVKKYGAASASLLQRKMRIGYPRAAQLMAELRSKGVVPADAPAAPEAESDGADAA